ncbi:MAG: DUF2721 domain-containing protein [Deltaproteobacteria bacterium]|nr:DUF2721 domain-containing protein [Nannocystaceae bacterium]
MGVGGDVAHAIQLALAPVFLLTGIAGILNVVASRLARVIDRGRTLTEQPRAPQVGAGEVRVELVDLDRRRRLASNAIVASTLSAFLVCTVIAVLFIEVLLQIDAGWVIAVLFTLTMIALVVGLAYFVREVHLAMRTVRIPVPASDR